MRRVSTMTAALLVVAVAARLSGQQPELPKPGPEHEHLKQLEGVWDASVHSKDGDSKGTMSYKMGLGGLWLLEHFKGDIGGGMTFEGHGGTTYDPAKKKYVSVWIDSMITSPLISEGAYDSVKKTMTMAGNMQTPDGKSMKVTMVTRRLDADNMVFTLTSPGPDGKDMEMMKISYKRQAK